MVASPKECKEKITTVKEPKGWVWQSAYVDAIAHNHVLPAYMWELLGGFYYKEGLNKYYKTRENAITALESVIHIMKIHIRKFETSGR